MKRSILYSTFLLLVFSSASPSFAKPTSLQLIQGTYAFAKLWREASLPQHRGSPEEIIAAYQRVIDTSVYLESPFKSWYLAVTHFGLARAYARLGLVDSARQHIQSSVDNKFWNFGVMYSDPVLRSCVGVTYLDSLSEAYKEKRSREERSWRVQVPVVHGPEEGTIWRRMGNIDSWFTDCELRGNTLDSMYTVRRAEMIRACRSEAKPNVIIALHGGNSSYREFGSHWAMIGQMTHAYVITPPGIVRYSSTMNSWDATYPEIDEYLTQLIEDLRDEDGRLPPIYLAGFSQGACIGLKFGLVHPEFVKAVIAFSGFMDSSIDPELVIRARESGMKFYAASGEYDSENFKATLRELSASFRKEGATFTFVEKNRMIHELPEPFFKHFSEAWRSVTN